MEHTIINRLVLERFHHFFFPWHHHPDYRLAETTIVEHPQELLDYFDELQRDQGIVLSPGQKAWYTKKYETQQDEMKREFPSTPEEAFEAAIVGSSFCIPSLAPGSPT